jgi:hypothetical protein
VNNGIMIEKGGGGGMMHILNGNSTQALAALGSPFKVKIVIRSRSYSKLF